MYAALLRKQVHSPKQR